MTTEAQYTALNAIGRKCNDKLKQVNKKDLHAITAIFNSFKTTVESIGFTMMDLKVQVGRINGQLTDRRLD